MNKKRPPHRIIIPDDIWDWFALNFNKINPAEDMRRALREKMAASITEKKTELCTNWELCDWCDYMMENDYYGQCASEGYADKHYEVITGLCAKTGRKVSNPFSRKTFAMIAEREKETNLWNAVISGFHKYMKRKK